MRVEMRRRTKWLIATGAISIALIGGLWLEAPSIVRWKIHDRYPDVTVGEVELGWKIIHLKNITFDRKWLRGALSTAAVTWDEDVDIDGGQLDVNLDDKPTGQSSTTGGRSVTFKNLTVHVAKGQATADLQNVESSPGHPICWASGAAKHPRAEVAFLEGCAEKDGSQAKAADVTLKALDIPRVPAGTTLGLQNVVYDGAHLTAASVKGAVVLVGKDPAEFSAASVAVTLPTGDVKPSVEAASFTVMHPWISFEPVTFEHVKASSPRRQVVGDHHQRGAARSEP